MLKPGNVSTMKLPYHGNFRDDTPSNSAGVDANTNTVPEVSTQALMLPWPSRTQPGEHPVQVLDHQQNHPTGRRLGDQLLDTHRIPTAAQ